MQCFTTTRWEDQTPEIVEILAKWLGLCEIPRRLTYRKRKQLRINTNIEQLKDALSIVVDRINTHLYLLHYSTIDWYLERTVNLKRPLWGKPTKFIRDSMDDWVFVIGLMGKEHPHRRKTVEVFKVTC
jgi:hypothetical protein